MFLDFGVDFVLLFMCSLCNFFCDWDFVVVDNCVEMMIE